MFLNALKFSADDVSAAYFYKFAKFILLLLLVFASRQMAPALSTANTAETRVAWSGNTHTDVRANTAVHYAMRRWE